MAVSMQCNICVNGCVSAVQYLCEWLCQCSAIFVWMAVSMQCNISGVVLHLCDTVGTWAVYTLWHSVCCLCHLAECHRVHLSRADVLSALCWGLPMVVEIHLQCWVWFIAIKLCFEAINVFFILAELWGLIVLCYYMVPTGPEKAWNSSFDFSGPEKYRIRT